MKLITGPLGGGWLRDCLSDCEKECTAVRAAIAYAEWDMLGFFQSCMTSGKALDFYGRYDSTVPVDPRILRWFIERANLDLRCYLVPDFLHAKVIWWVDKGAYIGSANLSDRAWNRNFEVGTFFDRSELVDLGLDERLETFFEKLSDHSTRLSLEIVEEQEQWAKKQGDLDARRLAREREFDAKRLIPKGSNPVMESNEPAGNRHYKEFQSEWNATLELMRTIAQRVSSDEFRPDWIPEDVPGGAQADQFLHGFYYQQVKQGIHYHVDEFHKKNVGRADQALIEAMQWWKSGKYDHQHEFTMLTDWAKTVRETFARENLPTLTENEWVKAASCVHAIRDYAGKQSLRDGVPMAHDDKVGVHCHALWQRKSALGKSVRELLQYVIWGPGPVAERLWRAHRTDEWKIEGIGLSSLGEIVGWARPDEFPPRNMRTSKGLRALGNNVRV